MFFGQNHPDTIKIIFSDKSFCCHDLNSEGRIDIRARAKVEELVNELNKQTKGVCLSFPYYVFLFLLVYIGSFIGVMASRKFYLMFIPILAFICFFIGILWFSISYGRFGQNINKIVDRYRVEISPYYTLMNNIRMYQGNYNYAYNEQAIYLFPINGNNAPEAGNIFMPGRVNTQAPIYNMQGYYNPNMQQQQHYNRNPSNNQEALPTQGLNPGHINTNVYTPPQNIPIYTYHPEQNNDNNAKDYEDKPLKNKYDKDI